MLWWGRGPRIEQGLLYGLTSPCACSGACFRPLWAPCPGLVWRAGRGSCLRLPNAHPEARFLPSLHRDCAVGTCAHLGRLVCSRLWTLASGSRLRPPCGRQPRRPHRPPRRASVSGTFAPYLGPRHLSLPCFICIRSYPLPSWGGGVPSLSHTSACPRGSPLGLGPLVVRVCGSFA